MSAASATASVTPTVGVSATPTSTGSATPSLSPSATPASPCPNDGTWHWYQDDGTEGHDSCWKSGATSGNWATDRDTKCGPGHLITFGGSSKFTGLYAAILYHYRRRDDRLLAFSIGCSQSHAATSTGQNWTWVDGTPASNLNCGPGSNGCGLWAPGAPADCGSGEAHCNDYCVIRNQFLNDNPIMLSGYVLCELDLPAGTLCLVVEFYCRCPC